MTMQPLKSCALSISAKRCAPKGIISVLNKETLKKSEDDINFARMIFRELKGILSIKSFSPDQRFIVSDGITRILTYGIMLKKKRRSEEPLSMVKNCSIMKKFTAVPKKKSSIETIEDGEMRSENISFLIKEAKLLFTWNSLYKYFPWIKICLS